MDLHEAEALFAITLSRARTASPACGRRQKVREIVRIKREGGREERGERERGRDGGDLIIYRKKAVPHFSPPPSLSLSLSRWRHSVAGVWRRERGLFPPLRGERDVAL